MTDNEKLIEEARRWPAGVGPIPSAAPANIITRLAEALEAAEKAHTPTDDEREALKVASRETWGWDRCIVCGSDKVTDRGVILVVSKTEGVFLARLGWCDSSEECRADLRQAGASILTPDDAEAFDAAGFRRSEVLEPAPTHDPLNCPAGRGTAACLLDCPRVEPQGEPSDARGIIARRLIREARMDSFSAWDLADDMIAALRAAGGVR